MNDLSKTRIIILLTDSSQKVTDTEMQDAYDEFIRCIATIGNSKDNSNIFRMLNLTRIEIAPLKELYQYEQGGGNALKNSYLHKVLAIINVELELLSLKIKHPESFVSPISPTSESDLYVIPKSKDLGIIGIAEIVIGLSFLGEVVGKDGKPVPLVRLAHGFEVLFNLKFGSIYDKLDAIFMRKPFNLTKTLDALKNAINKEARKRSNKH